MGNLPLSPDDNPWIARWFGSIHVLRLTVVIASFGIFMHPILFVLHLWRKIINKEPQALRPGSSLSRMKKRQSGSLSLSVMLKRRRTDIVKALITWIPLLTLLFALAASLITLVNTKAWFRTGNQCPHIAKFQNICWVICKLTIYQVLILRLYFAFRGSTHAYNEKMMLVLFLIVTGIAILFIILSSTKLVTAIMFDDLGWCLLIIDTYLIMLPVILDLFCSILSLVLFLKPLKFILHVNSGHSSNDIDPKMINIAQLITKLVLLTCVSIITNMFGGIFFGITDIAFFTYLDTVVNPICLLLMERAHRDIYKILCFGCHISCHKCIHKPPQIRNNTWPSDNHIFCCTKDKDAELETMASDTSRTTIQASSQNNEPTNYEPTTMDDDASEATQMRTSEMTKVTSSSV